MHAWPIYGALLVVVVVRSWAASAALRLAAIVLLADWIWSNALHWFASDYRPLFPVLDIILAAVFLSAWLYSSKPWVAVVSALYGISSLVGWLAYGPGNKYSFDLALNAAFLARLAVVWISSSEPRKAQKPI